MSNWNEIVIAAIGGGALTQLVTFLLGIFRGRRDKYELLFDKLDADNARLRHELSSIEVRYEAEMKKQSNMIIALEAKIGKLHGQIIALESAHFDHPFPSWLKDTDGTVLFVNRAYEQTFLQPQGLWASDCIGHSDFDVWPDDVAKQFQKHDKMVARTGKTLETLEVMRSKDGSLNEQWRVLKYPRYNGRTMIGTAGMAIPMFNNDSKK